MENRSAGTAESCPKAASGESCTSHGQRMASDVSGAFAPSVPLIGRLEADSSVDRCWPIFRCIAQRCKPPQRGPLAGCPPELSPKKRGIRLRPLFEVTSHATEGRVLRRRYETKVQVCVPCSASDASAAFRRVQWAVRRHMRLQSKEHPIRSRKWWKRKRTPFQLHSTKSTC